MSLLICIHQDVELLMVVEGMKAYKPSLLVVTTKRALCEMIIYNNLINIPKNNQQLNEKENMTKAKCINQFYKNVCPSLVQENLGMKLHHEPNITSSKYATIFF